jgi:hypothetical protein
MSAPLTGPWPPAGIAAAPPCECAGQHHVVLSDWIDHILLLADTSCACALDRVRALEYESTCFSLEPSREREDLLKHVGPSGPRMTKEAESDGG